MKNLRKENEIYETPKCEVIEIQNEGVLCGSELTNSSQNDAFNTLEDTQSFVARGW